MYNTIILLKGEADLTRSEFKEFAKGDTIWGADRDPQEIKRWNMNQEKEAKTELEKLRCEYHVYGNEGCVAITEYALEYCETDEDGEFVKGSDFDLAAEV